ncbi:unnamed protein product, partial [Mesorhabditis belari]|uniref:Lon protease homolog, mitochondrial n=1 Tax=Mesorhabditis belari TaxID=2138241 RepID=A0AAF3FAQ6_9BILA
MLNSSRRLTRLIGLARFRHLCRRIDVPFPSVSGLALQHQSGTLHSYRQYSSNPNENNGGEGDGAKPMEPAEEIETALVQSDFGDMARMNIPELFPDVPIIAINRYPLFPGFIKKVDIVSDEKLKKLIRKRVELRQPYVGVFVKKDNEDRREVVNSLGDIYNVGTFAHILEMRDQGNCLELVLSAQRRIRLLNSIDNLDFDREKSGVNERRQKRSKTVTARVPSTTVNPITTVANGKENEDTKVTDEKQMLYMGHTENFKVEPAPSSNETKATMQAIVSTIREIVGLSPLFGQQIHLLLHPSQNVSENPIYLCDLVATLVQSSDTEEVQQIMQETLVAKRLASALVLAQKEKTVAQLKFNITKDVEKRVQDQHRKYLLQEQLKIIKKELGMEKDDKSTILEKIDQRIKKLKVPDYALKVIEEEKNKLQFLEPHSSEFSVTRNYLDWLSCVPWGLQSDENCDLGVAKEILDKRHYGMKDVKERILEFIAVNILKKKVGGKILCLHGPPGVGKTSIARSIAEALGRQYFRFSVGGMTDVAEIKGHRRTYVGSMPGKMIQCLKKVATENPLVLIDEVDKIGGAGYHGDPASALLELLDPEQNANFNDHFLDVPVDLSRVLFICTANEVDRVPGPLKDRMELLDVSGYLAEEKLAIAQNHLIPQARETTSLNADQLTIVDKSLETLIKSYCRESGVRNLQKQIEKIFRKAALKIASSKEDPIGLIEVNENNLEEFVGRPKYISDRLYEVTPPGVVMGLAWTAMGGSALYIETVLKRSVDEKSDKDGSLETTGNLGDVMKESIKAAFTVARRILSHEKPESNFFEKAHIHIHVPEGATPKDGPSAGVTLVSSLLSLAFNKPVVQKMAMTGEISLTGKVLPVGGIREKIIAARRVGATRVFLPAENKRDFADLPDYIQKDIEVCFVEHYDEIFKHLFV